MRHISELCKIRTDERLEDLRKDTDFPLIVKRIVVRCRQCGAEKLARCPKKRAEKVQLILNFVCRECREAQS